MYQTILVPLDGSDFGERALPVATELAAACRAQLVLVRAVTAGPVPGVDAISAQAAAVDTAELYLARVAEQLSRTGARCQTAAPYGSPADAIRLEVELRAADLIVMCTHGRSGLGRWIYGSIAEAVLRDSPVPVLLVRPTGLLPAIRRAAGARPAAARPTFLVPLDGSTFAEAALPHAAGLARAFGGTVQLLRAVVPPSLGQPSLDRYTTEGAREAEQAVDGEHREAERYLAEVAGRLAAAPGEEPGSGRGQRKQEDSRVDVVVRRGWPPDLILGQADSAGASLIVMSTHGRSGLGQALMGSVALEVLHHTLLPVLLVPRHAQPR